MWKLLNIHFLFKCGEYGTFWDGVKLMTQWLNFNNSSKATNQNLVNIHEKSILSELIGSWLAKCCSSLVVTVILNVELWKIAFAIQTSQSQLKSPWIYHVKNFTILEILILSEPENPEKSQRKNSMMRQPHRVKGRHYT